MGKQKHLTLDDYSLEDLREVVDAVRKTDRSWKIAGHPTRADSLTLRSKSGYIIHPDLGYINDDEDAAFMVTFDPAMVASLLDRIAELERR